MKVMVCQRPCGTLALRRWPRGAQPRSGAIGLGPGLIDEHQPSGIDPIILGPLRPPASDIGAILLGGNQRLFYN
jgi:hypothetical protein